MLPALLLALQAVPAAAPPGPEVVVTGERLKKLHDQCREGKCSPLRDAQASIAWAEAQFRDGRYVDAKRTLRDASDRAKRFAATDPKPAAAVFEAYATVSWQEGDQDIYRDAVAARVRTLRAHLPADDPHVRAAALAYGDMWVRLGQPENAERAYREAGRAATAAGRGDVALRALLARARLRHMREDARGAAALLAEAEKLSGADRPAARAAVTAMRVRFAAADGDGRELDRLARAMAGTGLTRPVLLYGPEYPRTAEDLADAQRNQALFPGALEALADVGPEPADIAAIQWADVGFWIRPDGRTAEIELLRSSREQAWAKPYLAQVAGRRYSAVGPADGEGVYRVERFTVRGNYAVPKGSLIRRRATASKLEVLDLTDPGARVTAAR